ncbi:MAG: DUF58 domain-containing protein [Chloroflexota bacterium]|jgi:uncharacterized protein (DUF58 family)
MEEVDYLVRESRRNEKRQARSRISKALRDGQVPGTEDVAKARGLVIRERHNSIFSDAWIPLAIIILIIGLVANRNAAVLAVGLGLFIIVGISTWWRRFSLLGVTYERSFDQTHVFPQEPLTMTLTVSNSKPLPLTWLQFKDVTPVAPTDRGKFVILASEISGSYVLENTFSMNAFERSRRTATFQFPRRGFYQIGPVRYLAGDVFTLFTVEREHRYLDTIVVYPNIWPLETLQLPARELFGELKVRRSLFTDPIKTQGVRDYQPQDRFRDVHWKATARRGDLQTKIYDPTSSMTVVTFLNVATFPRHWMGFDPDLLEKTISVAASISNYAAEQKWGIGFYANGSVPGSDQPIRVAPGRSPDQLMHILEALAAVTEFATGSIELLLYRESRKLPWAATLVLVTAVVTEEMLVSLVRLKEAGRRVTLISLADEPPPADLQGVLAYHVPPSLPAFQPDYKAETPTEMALSSIPPIKPENESLDDFPTNGRSPK